MNRGTRSLIIQLPTGAGKTCLTAEMLNAAAAKGLDSWFIVHRRELTDQSIETFEEVGVKHGIIASGFPANGAPRVQIASILSLSRRLQYYRKPSLIVWDECHHVAANSWSKIFEAFPNAFHIGLTATPERLDGKGLGNWFKMIISGPSMRWLIARGFLAHFRLFAPNNPTLDNVRTIMGDFDKTQLEKEMSKPSITGSAIREYMRHCPGQRAVSFCVSIKHSLAVVQEFKESHIPAAHLDGKTPIKVRHETLRKFRSGEIKIISNVGLFGEGFDLPSMEAVILLRPTKSLTMYLQSCGRPLRPYPGKEYAIILDHAGNSRRFGLPDDDFQWSLHGKKFRKTEKLPLRICPKCFAALKVGTTNCPYCSHEFETKTIKIRHEEGDLQEIKRKNIHNFKLRQQSIAGTLAELIRLGQRRGYKYPARWASHVLRARERKQSHHE